MQSPKIRRTPIYRKPAPDWVMTVSESFPEDLRDEA